MKREVGRWVAVAIVINSTIGTGIFKKPATVVQQTGSLGWGLALWVLGGVIALCGALSIAELAAAMPKTGGMYEYLHRAWGPKAAFLVSWTKLTLLIPSATGSFAKLAAQALSAGAGWGPDERRETWVAAVVLAVCAGVNVLGVRQSTLQQALLTSVKYVGVCALAFVALAWPLSGTPAPPVEPTPVSWSGVFAALVSVMWAYDGWADLSSVAGEVKNPQRTLPFALVCGTGLVMAVYVATNLGFARVLGEAGLKSVPAGVMVAGTVAETTLGELGLRGLSWLVFISCVGGCMSSLLTGSRLVVPLGGWLGRVTSTTAVPTNAVLASAGLGIAFVAWRSFEQLTDAFVVGYFPFYVAAVLGVWRLRLKEPALPRPFRVPMMPVVPLVFVAGAAALMLGAANELTDTTGLALAVVVVGLVIEPTWKKRVRRIEA